MTDEERFERIKRQEVLTLQDVMFYMRYLGYGYSEDTVRRWILGSIRGKNGEIPNVRPQGSRLIHVRKADLDAFLNLK